jgi:hypothetical protein
MQYLISVIDDAADLATTDEMAASGNPGPESRAQARRRGVEGLQP